MAERPATYSMADLQRLTGLSPRTIRFYISQGLLSPAHGRGPGATYDDGHLARLQAVQLLKTQHIPLDEIRQRLGELSDRQVQAMVTTEAQPIGDRWRRVRLHPDIELHVRERESVPAGALDDAIALILDLARPIIERFEASRR